MRYALSESQKSWIILLARILLMILFVVAGWKKIAGYSGTVTEMAAVGLPIPAVASVIVIIIEFLVGIALVIGVWTRPLALLMAAYTLATAFVGHHYWTMSGAAYGANFVNFYKNVSIVGGLLLLCVTGAAKYSIDRS